jgi:hypothetical protein
MKMFLLPFVVALFALVAGAADSAGEKHLLYVATPDGAQPGGSGAGVLIFDIADGHRLVRRIDIPVFKEGIRGFCANAPTKRAYYTTTNHLLGCLDLETDKVVWEKRYEVGCDRAAVTPDGKKLYVPTGWWLQGERSGWLVVDGANGGVLRHLAVGSQAHNTVMSLDGSLVFGGTETMLTVIRTSDDTIAKQISPIGESGVFPFTVNSRNTLAYVCLGKHVGVDIADLESGKVVHRVMAANGTLNRRTHGAALTPDERELWLSDQGGNRLYVFDATVMPPVEKAHVDLTAGGHGWITFSLDGRFAWCHTADVIDAKTRQIVATLRDESGEPVSSSKYFEAVFQDGKLTRVGDQFGVGRAAAAK